MWRKILVVAVCLAFPAAALAHLCSDVFAQARDNLAVKVDVRDGQLRIGQQASFRVYLLNTMDRDIATISLEVRTGGKFKADVKPSPDWKRHPSLKSVRQGGRKEYFEVTLQRMPGVPDGQYKIDLHLYNPKDKSKVFKTVDLNEAASIVQLAKAQNIRVDGSASQTEWGKADVCTDFCEYKPTPMEWRGKTFKGPKFTGKVKSAEQCRFRMAADGRDIYFYVNFQGGAGAESDEVTLYAAKAVEDSPVKLTVDRISGKVTCDKGTTGVECKVSANKSDLEVRIPRALLGLDAAKSFYGNVARETKGGGKSLSTYWRGTKHSAADPVEFACFKFAE